MLEQKSITETMKIELRGKEPIPPAKPGAPKKYPFDEMEVGDSFVIHCAPEERSAVQGRAHSAAFDRGVKIQTRSVDEGVQVWLVSKSRD